MSAIVAFRGKHRGFTLDPFSEAFDLYTTDLLFTLAIVLLSTVLIGLLSIAIAGCLTLGENPRAVAILRWLYRWPLFIPFIVTGQVMRTFLAKNGMLNHVLIGSGLIEPLSAQSLLDWRGIVVAFVWKQAPFVTLLVAGAMASLEPQHIEAARNLGARRLRVLEKSRRPPVAQWASAPNAAPQSRPTNDPPSSMSGRATPAGVPLGRAMYVVSAPKPPSMKISPWAKLMSWMMP